MWLWEQEARTSVDKETGVPRLGKCMKGKHANCRAARWLSARPPDLPLALVLLGTRAWATSHTSDELKPLLRGQKGLCNAAEKSSDRKGLPGVT